MSRLKMYIATKNESINEIILISISSKIENKIIRIGERPNK